MQDFWTYMLRCADGSYYAGHTDDLDMRMGQHRDGSLGGYTSRRRPVELVWSERFADRDSAFAAERQIKGWSRAKKEALIRGDWESLSQHARRVRPFPKTARGEEGLSSSRSERSEGPSRTTEIRRDGTRRPISREWVPEAPVALEFNGLAYAVMMATPADLADFALGFALTEGLAKSPADVADLAVAEVAQGWIVRASLTGLGIAQLTERVRARVAESSCGLCGIENLDAVARPLPPVAPHGPLDEAAIFSALAGLRAHQPLTRTTGAAHAAAFCSEHGEIRHVREDVGRHNAMDKLVGALAAAGPEPGIDIARGFVLSTARCSYEIVEKAVRAGATRLVTVSLPTSMAVARAEQAGLSLWCLARDDSVLRVNDATG
ncbi:MAG TPA: formate dehydrogenase accessory sulfurtransferase FdhD [Croceibacterium sp.]|nr:formate dehydrogenase accessory sulfurtransferase FdhD [Croceibacterium sp.]